MTNRFSPMVLGGLLSVFTSIPAGHAQAQPGYVNVRDFGAKGDGVENDAPAIQKAIDSLGNAGGTIYVPRGNYFIGMLGEHPVQCPAPQNFVGYGIQIRSNVTLTGDGPGATIFHAKHMKTEKEQYSVLVVRDAADVIIEKVGIHFDPLPVDPKEKRFVNEYLKVAGFVGERLQCGIDIRFSKRVTIRDIYVERASQGISLFFGNSDILIDGVRVHNCYGCGIGTYAGTGRTVVTNSLITDCSDGMLSSYANAGETEFLNNRVQVTADNARGDKYTQLITVELSKQVKVIGNHIKGGGPGIDVKRTRDTTILGNSLTDCAWGITIRAGDYAGGAGYSWRTLIANNTLENFRNPSGSGAFGIRVSTAVFATVEGNVLSNIEGDGITVSRYGEYRGTGMWPYAARGIVVANNLIVRRTGEHVADPGNTSSPNPTETEKWNPLDPAQPEPKGLEHIAHRAIVVSDATAISITGNVVRGGKTATWPHAGGIVVRGCEGFTFTGNTIGDGNQGRGLWIEKSSGAVSGNSLQGATEYALRVTGCKLTSFSANHLVFNAKDGAALDIDGETEDCTFMGNVIQSDGSLLREPSGGPGASTGLNTFAGNRGVSTAAAGVPIAPENGDTMTGGNVFRRDTVPSGKSPMDNKTEP